MSKYGRSGMNLNNQKGFTLIELIMVIVILGILAVVAVPKYVDMKTEAEKAAAEGVFGAAEAATAINFAKGLVGISGHTVIDSGQDLLDAMDGEPEGWAVVSGDTMSIASGSYKITVSAETGNNKAALSKTGF